MKQALTLSIVIPAYNEERHLKACLDAIEAQTIKPDEVIVVDNNSSDKTADIAKNYPFVTLLQEKEQGVVFARDRGFNAVKSEIIGRIDADTILPNNWVERVKKFYENPTNTGRALTGGGYPGNLRFPRFWGWVHGQIAFRVNRFLLGHYILFGSNMAIPKNLWMKVETQICHRTDVHEDLDLSIHVHRAGYKITYRESLRVSGTVRRVMSEHNKLLPNLMLWPQTLKTHHIKTWVLGWLGAILLYLFSPIFIATEYIARFMGRRPK